MTTIATLVDEERLLRIEVHLDHDQQAWRCLYGTPEFVQQLDHFMSEADPSPRGIDESLDEQLDALLNSFVAGDALHFDRQFHIMSPAENGIWELKTGDLRIFGWFSNLDHFVAVSIQYADQCKGKGAWSGFDPMYKWFRKQAEEKRAQLECNSICVWGKDPSDVLSSPDRSA